MNKPMLEAIATLVGTVIGAGIFAIPYVVAKAGFFTGMIDIVILGVIVTLISLYLGEITLRTKGKHQLTGYTERYLGKWGKRLMAFSMIFGIYGALLAYLIGEGESLFAIFGIASPLLFSIIFFIIMAALIYSGLKAIETSELYAVPVIIIIVIIIAILGLSHVNAANLAELSLAKIFIPYGVVLFALGGTAAIPEMREELAKNEKHLKNAILIGMAIPLLIYLLFAFITVGITGLATTQVATIGLGNMLGEKMILFGNIFAVFAMLTCFLSLGFALFEMYNYDFKLHKSTAWIFTCFVPLAMFIFLRNITGFATVIEVAGAIGMGVAGVLIVLMAWRAKKMGNRKPEFSLTKNKILGIILMAIFLFGMVYEILRILGMNSF
jgi:tyrosine-specific transport protein